MLRWQHTVQASALTAASVKYIQQAFISAALVERLSSAQREKERLLANQLRKVMDEKQQLLKRLKDKGEDIR